MRNLTTKIVAKDPALLFYTSDFLTGTMFMSNEQVGKYIRLLCAQHQQGRLTHQHMINICQTYDKTVFDKFTVDEDGLYFNQRLEIEIVRRKNYSESRSKNRLSKKTSESTYVPHMETVTENSLSNSSNTGDSKFSANMMHGKNYVESFTLMEKAIRVFRDNGLTATEENVKHVCRKYITEMDAKDEQKQTLKLFASHFVSWSKMHGKKYQLKSNSPLQ